ncbi:hypothetical protein ASD8599_00326 [Ascidiaceihabitans donghaensis]|uniref:Uncharacterized protein n=1 Tax=Ascidiaceihabitans donghaensis TaxID=1510460 RepID=A0A2R8B974_9RHOB|nr:hypothetical protein [Ascidiaceihabitans donghaensis]SPH19591.1 hypothetical protein ASD8599_00326 [Ascidiaceihabitans donghaensis]
MKKQRFVTNTTSVRKDGKLAFSPQGRAIADRRIDAQKLSRIQKKLGTDDTFSDEFKAAFDPQTEYGQILERVQLETELDAARKTITALRKYPDDPHCQRILDEMWARPTARKKDFPLCPIWRHERETRQIFAAQSRYAFPRVTEELYLVTIIFDFAENLDQLEEAMVAAHRVMQRAVAHMGRKRHGVTMTGTLEFDLKTFENLTNEPKSISLLKQLGVTATDAGGWTLTGHFFTRVPHREVLEDWLRKTYPSSTPSWHRVQFDQVKQNKKLLDHLSKILSYVNKMPMALFKPPTRKTKGGERETADELMRRMSAAFYGATMNTHVDQSVIDLNAAIVQWAKFVDRVGPKLLYYSVESSHAQKWYSESEMDYIRMIDADMTTDEDRRGGKGKKDGEHKIELHRDHGLLPPFEVPPHLKGRVRDLRSRPLTYDAEWDSMTNCSGINPDTHYHDFDRWSVKP